jgi:nuclease S1
MRKISLLLGLLLIAASFPPLVWAWGGQGHRTVGAIADRLLTPPARAAVARLLAGDLDKFGRPSGRTSLEAVSVWADEITHTPAAQPRWHYDDAPVCGGEALARYCPDGQCNSAQLGRLIAVLREGRGTLRERNEALKWVVHLLGDLHQPLHAADNADRGGNEVPVVLAGVRTRGRENLHRAWDVDLVRLALHARGGQRPPRDVAELAQEAASLVKDAGQGSPGGWALESNNLARNVAYHYGEFACTRGPAAPVLLDAAYQQEAAEIVRERLLLAGARLAGVLNQVFEGASE